MNKYIKIFSLTVLLFIGLTGCTTLGTKSNSNTLTTASLKIAGQDFTVEIADTPASQTQGLSGRNFLAANVGMLFILPKLSSPGFWMKDMNFPIDIIWIKDNQIVDWVTASPVPTGEPLPIYYPPELIDTVLEINAGLVDKMGIQKGEDIIYSKNLDSFIHMR